jgi:Arc/MetJ family transcription regulator
MPVARTTVDVDPDALAAARAVLGAGSLSATVNAALREVARRSALIDFDVQRDIDGSPAEVEAGREERKPARPE